MSSFKQSIAFINTALETQEPLNQQYLSMGKKQAVFTKMSL